jgi:predicted MPP superfamily phosphohydrolase
MHPTSFAPFLAAVLIFFLLLDWYAYQGIKTISEGWQSTPWIYHGMRWGYWAVCLALPAVIIYLLFQLSSRPDLRPLLMTVSSMYMTLLITKVVFIVPLLGEDIARLGHGILSHFSSNGSDTPFVPERRKFISQMAIGVAAIPFTSFLYGILKGKYDYRVHRHTVYFPDLPEAFDGLTITQISDVHAGSFDNPEAVRRGIELINRQHSDVVVFTGDLVNSTSREFEPWKEMFGTIRAKTGKFSILGNHDYGDYASWPSQEAKQENLRELFQHHQHIGFRLLRNEAVMLEKDGQSIALLGVENWGKGFHQYGDLEAALRGVPQDAFKVLLSHDPTHWENQVKEHATPIHLTLSGHTHGMQMGVEIPGFRWSPIKYRYPRWAGLYSENERYLYINRGFGFLGFSGRVGILPEITVLELKRAVE